MTKDDELMHYGILRKSGRYPWGSGENPYQNSVQFYQIINDLKKQGLTDPEIAKALDIQISELSGEPAQFNTTKLRTARTIAKNEIRKEQAAQALRLKDRGWSNVKIGERMGVPESTVRNLLSPAMQDREDVLVATANFLREDLEKNGGYLDIGKGTENWKGISKEKLASAVAILEDEGYRKLWPRVPQAGTQHETTVKILVPPGVTMKEVAEDYTKIRTLAGYSEDKGRTWLGIKTPVAVDPNRVEVRYAEDGGDKKDGIIELRRGVEDLTLGQSRYAQVRVQVGDGHFLKGMAMYSDDLPDGVDILFNTNKSKDSVTNKLSAMKGLKDDEDNPFGSTIRQIHYTDSKGKERLSPLNIVGAEDPDGVKLPGEEGAWSTWSNKLSSQMLSKQSTELIKEQLGLSYDLKRQEFEEINQLDNPSVKKRLLRSFADDVDASAVHLKAASLPRTANHVILPINTLKDNEIYAPHYNNGETVVLIRHPHGGIFEIPELVVNNNNREANRLIKNARDAVGINANVAAQLSGADFDGDTVLVIPNNPGNKKIRVASPLKDLRGFEPQQSYPPFDGMRTIDGGHWNAETRKIEYAPGVRPKPNNKQQAMGDISNLITDMTLKGAIDSEIAAAVRHSMVVIDSEKHALNWKQSAKDNGIRALKAKYQGGANRGASTLISSAKSEIRIPRVKKYPSIDRDTGELVWTPTGDSYIDKKTGAVVASTSKFRKMELATDAHTLSSGTVREKLYADYANQLKSLANESRKVMVNTKGNPYDATARRVYQEQVDSLVAKLNIAQRNAPLERQAQIVANSILKAKVAANPDITNEGIRKVNAQALDEARRRIGSGKELIKIEPKEWEAIQAGAITPSRLDEIMNHTDLDILKQMATPRKEVVISDAILARARAMVARGYTQAEVASALGISTSTVNKATS